MSQIRFSGSADLAFVLLGGEYVRPTDQVKIVPWMVFFDLRQNVF
jgi:hypothetical protein